MIRFFPWMREHERTVLTHRPFALKLGVARG